MATKIQLRRDTAANWTSTNPTLSQGEPGFETDTGKLKIGDGATAWNSLPYAGGATEPTTSTGTAIQFDKDRFYGESSAETGAFTLNSSGLVKGTTVVVRHNHATDNPFLTSDAEFIVVGGEYVVNEDNYIYMHAWSASVIHCNIVQHP